MLNALAEPYGVSRPNTMRERIDLLKVAARTFLESFLSLAAA